MSIVGHHPMSGAMKDKCEADDRLLQPVFRFAPSPNGPLHRGHARSALLNAALARRFGGRFLLRIEDIDPTRSRPDHIDAIFETMDWLKIHYETPVRYQSQHMDDYARAFDRLNAMGLVYPCFCTRSQLQEAGDASAVDPDGAPLYPGTCKGLSHHLREARESETGLPQWRLDMARAVAMTGPLSVSCFDPLTGDAMQRMADPLRWGDVVIRRKDTPTSYHLSVVVDDALQGITHVVRGVDLEAATDIHRVLQVLLDLPSPLYWHHPLILGNDGRKLAKSKGSDSLALERDQGLTLADVVESFGAAGFAGLLSDTENRKP
jgi:glutamyl-Q tRNA(Asp) synthetase